MSITADRILAVRTTKTVYRDGETVLKVFAPGTPAVSVMREAMNQSAAEEVGLPVPHLYEVTRMDDRWVIRSAYVRGKTLRQSMEADPDGRQVCLARLAEMHAALHRFHEKRLLSLSALWRDKIQSFSLSADAREAFSSVAASLRETDCICHGEFTPSNLILSPEGNRIYILDWAHAACGDAAADAARTAVLLHLHTESTEETETYLASYERFGGEAVTRVEKLMPLAALSLAARYGNHKSNILNLYLEGN